MTQTQTPTGRATGGRPINLVQLQAELAAAGVTLDALGQSDEYVYPYDADGLPTDFPAGQQATVDQVIAAHIALRDKTDAEYATEFQAADTGAVRRQEIRDITSGLLPREQVRVDNGQPLNPPVKEPDPLEVIKSIPLGSTTDELRDALVVYLDRFGG